MPSDPTQDELQRVLGDCVLSNAWLFSTVGALVSIPLGIKRKSLAPLVFYGGSGAMLDLIVGIQMCKKEREALQEYIANSKGAAGKPMPP